MTGTFLTPASTMLYDLVEQASFFASICKEKRPRPRCNPRRN